MQVTGTRPGAGWIAVGRAVEPSSQERVVAGRRRSRRRKPARQGQSVEVELALPAGRACTCRPRPWPARAGATVVFVADDGGAQALTFEPRPVTVLSRRRPRRGRGVKAGERVAVRGFRPQGDVDQGG